MKSEPLRLQKWRRLRKPPFIAALIVTGSLFLTWIATASNFLGIASYLKPALSIEAPSSQPWGAGSGEFILQNLSIILVNIVLVTCMVTSYGGQKTLLNTPIDPLTGKYVMIVPDKYVAQELDHGLSLSAGCDILEYMGFNPDDVSLEIEVYYRTAAYNPVGWFFGVIQTTQKFSAHKDSNGTIDWMYGSRDLGLFEVDGYRQPCHEVVRFHYPDDRFERVSHPTIFHLPTATRVEISTCRNLSPM